MLKTNMENLIEAIVAGPIAHPAPLNQGLAGPHVGFVPTFDGRAIVPVVTSGITLNVKAGDRAFGWAWGDHVVPGAAIRHPDKSQNSALHTLACIGNEATVVSAHSDAKESRVKGLSGTVIGKNICADVVSIHFPRKTLEKLSVGDLIQIKACGQGMSLPDYPGIRVMNCSPALFKAINPTEKGGRIRVPVTSIIPGKLMGSGIGAANSYSQGCDIQSTSPEVIKEYKIENLRLGDLIAVADFDASFGGRWHNGALTVGTVVHGASAVSGHGPGISILFTSAEGMIEPVITRKANTADLLGLP
jgi:hypothetical protein